MSEAMPSIQLTTSAIKELPGHVSDGEPLMVLHLLRYRDSVGPGKSNRTGRQSFEHYLQMTRPVLMQGGGRPLWRGHARLIPASQRITEYLSLSECYGRPACFKLFSSALTSQPAI